MDEKIRQIRAQLTGPGAPFEIVEEEVLGARHAVFKERRRSLREYVVAASAFADREYLVNDNFTLADLGYLPYLQGLMDAGCADMLDARPALAAWWARCSARRGSL